MAKKKAAPEPTGPGTLMILVLVFFVLTTLILGVTTYLGFDGQTKLEEAAKQAQEKEKTAKANAEDNLIRLNVNRIAMGTDTPQVREDISGGAKANAGALLDEYKQITDKLGRAAFPNPNDFRWPLVADVAAGGDGSSKPAPAPNKTIPQIAKEWAKLYQDMKTKYQDEVAAHKKTLDSKIAADKRADDQKATFDADVGKLTQQIKDKIATMDVAFQNLKKEADQKGLDFRKTMDQWAEDKARLEETVRQKDTQHKVDLGKIQQLQFPDASALQNKLDKLDLAKLAERMGTVGDKSDPFVNIQFKSKFALVPGQTFVVLAPDRSLSEVIDREKVLEQKHREFKSDDPREPFSDNELVKGMVEITEVTSPLSARARITRQQGIRNPISKGDQLFNMALSTGEREHVAFAGIIDLDGDGRHDNEQFIRILEQNNLRVDAYLDLKTGEIKGRIDFKTKFLIIGSDAPVVGNVKAMIAQAKEKSVQLIDARMFLALIGVKPPKNPAAPLYSGVTLGGEGSLNKGDPEAPMPPAGKDEPKKDEPKKDEPKKD